MTYVQKCCRIKIGSATAFVKRNSSKSVKTFLFLGCGKNILRNSGIVSGAISVTIDGKISVLSLSALIGMFAAITGFLCLPRSNFEAVVQNMLQ